MTTRDDIRVGVLALQGDFDRHLRQLALLGVAAEEIRAAEALTRIDGLIIPGGESTTMSYLIDKYAMRTQLTDFCRRRPVWGTCAGMIMLSQTIEDNASKVTPLGMMDIDVIRNGYGRQVFSVEEPVEADLGGAKTVLTASFIRAPRVTRLGPKVTTLAVYRDDPALVRQGNLLASSFHTELDDDVRLLAYFVDGMATDIRD